MQTTCLLCHAAPLKVLRGFESYYYLDGWNYCD